MTDNYSASRELFSTSPDRPQLLSLLFLKAVITISVSDAFGWAWCLWFKYVLKYCNLRTVYFAGLVKITHLFFGMFDGKPAKLLMADYMQVPFC